MTRNDDAIVVRLNDTSLSDAAGARDEVVRLLRTLSNGERAALIEGLANGAESRLRQTVARAVQIAGHRAEIVPVFERWLEDETDEFTRAAIEDALTPEKERSRKKQLLTDLHSVPKTYRYLTDRLRHRILNAMPGAGLSVTKLKDIAASLSSDQHRHLLMKEIDYLSATFARLQRAIDFVEERTGFDLVKLDIVDWLRQFERGYRAEWQQIEVRILPPDSSVMIHAVPYLLETVFRNLLDNGRQAIQLGGWVAIELTVPGRSVRIQISDSGPGLSNDVAYAAFKLPVTTKGRPGRGFLEVADAMRRLGGQVEISDGANGARVVLTFQLAS